MAETSGRYEWEEKPNKNIDQLIKLYTQIDSHIHTLIDIADQEEREFNEKHKGAEENYVYENKLIECEIEFLDRMKARIQLAIGMVMNPN